MPYQVTIEDNAGNVVGFMSEDLNPATKAVEKNVAILPPEKRFHRSRGQVVKPDSLGLKVTDLPSWIGTVPKAEQVEVEEVVLFDSVAPPEKTPAEIALESIKSEKAQAGGNRPGR